MGNGAPLLLVLTIAVLVPSGVTAENTMLLGKSATWETWGQEPKGMPTQAAQGESLETPNQKRRRLGLPAVASIDPEIIGVAEETPNHRRQRESQDRLAEAR